MTELIIFDWDDVFVIGAIKGYFACYRKSLADVGVTVKESKAQQIIKQMWGRPHQSILGALLGEERQHLLPKAVSQYRSYKKSDVFLGHLTFVPGGQDFLRRLATQYQLAIATSQQRDLLVNHIFPQFDVPDVFSDIISSHDLDDPLKSKPHPFMINYLLNKHKVASDNAIMVGDAENDVAMAQNASVTPVVVLTGHLDRQQAD